MKIPLSWIIAPAVCVVLVGPAVWATRSTPTPLAAPALPVAATTTTPTFTYKLNGPLMLTGTEHFTNPAEDHKLELAIENADTGARTLLATRDLSGPGHSVSIASYEYQPTLAIRTLTQWEGYDDRYADYIRIEDGSLALTTRFQNGQGIILSRGEKKLDIELSPKGACDDNRQDPDGKIIQVTGVNLNGVEKRFSKPYPVRCLYSEMMNQGFYPGMLEPEYTGQRWATGKDYATVNLPIPVSLQIDVDLLSPEGVEINEL